MDREPWVPDGRLYSIPGWDIWVSAPAVVIQGKAPLNFPTLVRLADGDLLASAWSTEPPHDRTPEPKSWLGRVTGLSSRQPPPEKPIGLYTWSGDGGQTWSEPVRAPPSKAALTLRSGDHLLYPMEFLFRPSATDVSYCVVPHGLREIQIRGERSSVNGWLAHPTGGAVWLEDGYLATFVGHPVGGTYYAVFTAGSRDGVQWELRSILADGNWGSESSGFGHDSALCQLRDGRLLCVFSAGAHVPSGECWSSDKGRNWTAPTRTLYFFPYPPRLLALEAGPLIRSGVARFGIQLEIDPEGSSERWYAISLTGHHNWLRPYDAIPSGGATDLVALDERTLLCIYSGGLGHHIRPQSRAHNAVCVVRLSFTRPTASRPAGPHQRYAREHAERPVEPWPPPVSE